MQASGTIASKTVAFTGTIQSMARADTRSLAQQLGARASGSNSKNAGLAGAGAKAKKASELCIKDLDGNSWLNCWQKGIRRTNSIIG